jgi:hypothetical protein
MTWDENDKNGESTPAVAPTEPAPAAVEAAPETPAATESAAAAPETAAPETKAEGEAKESKTSAPPAEANGKADDMVPNKLIGKVAKKLREKNKEERSEDRRRIQELQEENERLRKATEAPPEEVNPIEQEEDQRVTLKVRKEFLKLEDARGRKLYGQDYDDAVALVKSQNDPALINRLQWADNPTEALMKEAARIADQIEYGADPSERDRKKEQEIETRVRRQVEAEYAEKLKARTNQPTDVQNVRAAGGDARPRISGSSWDDSLPK